MMNDEQLIELVQQKLPEDLSLDEVRILRDRLAESAELREALLRRLQLEHYLAAALGRVDVSVDAILERAQEQRDARSSLFFTLFGGAIVLALFAGLTALVIVQSQRGSGGPSDATEVAQLPVDADGELPWSPVTPEPEGGGREVEPAELLPSMPEDDAAIPDAPADDGAPNGDPDADAAQPDREDPGAEATEEEPGEPKLVWQRSLGRAPVPFDDVWVADFATDEGPLSRDGVLQWFAPVAGQPNRLHEQSQDNMRYGVLDGVYRLQCPLPANAVWKMAVRHSERFFVHIYHGDQGVTIRRYEHAQGAWAAYQTRRDPGKPLPKSFALTATDDLRASRSEAYYGRTYLIWYAAGEVVATVGDIEVLRAPLPGPPTDVFVQGKAMFDGMALVPTVDLPQRPAEFPVVATVDRPAELDWSGELPEGAEFNRLPDGAVELVFDKPQGCGWIAARLPGNELCVVDVLVEEASLGTSVFLGGGARFGEENKPVPAGKPESVVSLMTNQHAKRINLQQRFVHDWGIGQEWRKIEDHVEPCTRLPFYVRFLASPGQARFWYGNDGIHWTGAFPLHAKDVRNLQYVGIGFGSGMDKPGSIRLKRIVQRELAVLSALAPAELRQRAVAKTEADDMAAWSAAMLAEKPADVDLGVWRRACAVRTLAAGCNGPLGQRLLECLLADAMQTGTFEERLAVLREAALLTSTWRSDDEHRERLKFFLGQYHQLAIEAARSGQTRPFSLVRRAAMSAPLTTDAREKLFDKELIRDEMIRLVYAGEWPLLDRFLRELWFFAGSEDYMRQVAPLAPWARAMIARHLPKKGGGDVAVIKAAWRHPLVEEWSKEAFNVCAELRTAIDSEAWNDACRIVTMVDPREVAGLAPGTADQRLLVSLPAMVDIAMRESPELRAVMAERLASIGQVRLNQACAEGDAEAVHAIALQFHGTPAAAEAHRWLGDRALSSGRFSAAMLHYEQAGAGATETPDSDLAARMRLAAALMGEDYGQSVTAPVRVGDTVVAAAEFEKMVADLRSNRAGKSLQPLPPVEPDGRWDEPPDAAEFQFRESGRVDAIVGAEPRHDPRGIRDRDVHAIDRQLSWVVADRTLYLNSRYQIAAFDLNSGQRKWISQFVPGPQANAVEWPLVPMRPVVTAARVYARQLAAKSPAIVCLDRATGKTIWTYHEPNAAIVVSDPIVVRGRLNAFVVKEGAAETDSLELVVLDPEVGRGVETHTVVRLRKSWRTSSVCQVLPLRDQMVAVLGGIIISLDGMGSVRWVRRQEQMPPEEDYLWIRQDHQLPLLHDSKLYVTCPGVRTVDCIHPQTGALLFSRVMPHIERCLGIAAGRLIVQTNETIEALDPVTGETVWRHETHDPLSAYLCGPSVVYSRRYTAVPSRNLRAPELVWLDPETGLEVATIPIPQMSDDWPRLAALVPHEERLWALFGRGDQRYRALCELTPTGEKTPRPMPEPPTDPWLAHVPAKLHQGAARVLPGWMLVSGEGGDQTGYAVGIFLSPAAGVKSNRKSRFAADISNRPRDISRTSTGKKSCSGRFRGPIAPSS